jgi:hypothetical protein
VLQNSNQHSSINPSQSENNNGDVENLMLQGDAIYDYERVPAAWGGFDDQPTVHQYGDASVWQTSSDDNSGMDKLAS